MVQCAHLRSADDDMSNYFKRIPKNYDGTKLTTHKMSDLLPNALDRLVGTYQDQAALIIAAWPQVLGAQLAPMTQVLSFIQGILVVKVNNSTLYSLLSQHEKPRLLANLRRRFPDVEIKNILFRIG